MGTNPGLDWPRFQTVSLKQVSQPPMGSSYLTGKIRVMIIPTQKTVVKNVHVHIWKALRTTPVTTVTTP